MWISHATSKDKTVATKPWSNHSGEPIVWSDEEPTRFPRVAWIERQVRERYSKSRLLDVGFSIRRQNTRAQVVGVDVNVEEMFKKRLSNVVGARAESMAFKHGSFEVVLCLELLEHLYSPINVLLEFWRVLRLGGDLILTTPNA